MKRFFWIVPALLALLSLLIWYRFGVIEEARLNATWTRVEMQLRNEAQRRNENDPLSSQRTFLC